MPFKPMFTITPKINKILMEIERVRGFLEAITLKDDWMVDMRREALILESHHSTHIEGTALNLEQARDILKGNKIAGIRRDDERALLNYEKAMAFISRHQGKDIPVTEMTIKKLHKMAVTGVKGGSADPGHYRKIRNGMFAGKKRKTIYTPPRPAKVPQLMRELVTWIDTPGDLSPVLTAGVVHFQFDHIHPFTDGNGRTARLLSTLILYKMGYDFKRLFTISEFYDKDRLRYDQGLQAVRDNHLDMTGWLEYFVEGLRSQINAIEEKRKKWIGQDHRFGKIKMSGINLRQDKAIKYLQIKNSISVKYYKEVVSCSLRTAQRDLEILVAKGIIKAVARGRIDPYKYFVLR